MIEEAAIQSRDEAREIKHDLKAEIVRTEKIVESIDRRVKAIQDDTRKMIDKENDRNDKLFSLQKKTLPSFPLMR